jgi:hypothetical protein
MGNLGDVTPERANPPEFPHKGEYITPKGSKKGLVFQVVGIRTYQNDTPDERQGIEHEVFPLDSKGKPEKGIYVFLQPLGSDNPQDIKKEKWSDLQSSYRVATQEEIEKLAVDASHEVASSLDKSRGALTPSADLSEHDPEFDSALRQARETLRRMNARGKVGPAESGTPVNASTGLARDVVPDPEPGKIDEEPEPTPVATEPETPVEPLPEPEPKPERGSYSAQQIESVIKELLLSNEKVKKIDTLEIRGGAGIMGLRIEMSVKTPPFVSGEVIIEAELKNTNEGITISNYKIDAHSLVKSALEKELVPRLTQVSTILSKYIEENSGKKVTKIEITDTGELSALFDSQAAAESEPQLTPEARAILDFEVEKQLQGKQQDTPRQTLEDRLGLTPDQVTERELLEGRVDIAREEYVKHQHDFESKSSKLKTFFGLKHIENTDAGHLAAYKKAQLDLQDFDTKALGNALGWMSPEEQKVAVESYLKRFSVEEWSKGWKAKEEERVASQNGFQKFTDWLNNTKAGKWYQKEGQVIGSIPIWRGGKRMNITTSQLKKAAIGVGALALHGGAVAVGGAVTPVAAVGYLLFRIATGTLAYQGTKELAAKGNQALFDRGRTGKTRELLKEIEKTGGIPHDMLAKLNQATQDYIATADKQLTQKKRQAVTAKALAFAGIFGLPGYRFASDISSIMSPDAIPLGEQNLRVPNTKQEGTGAAAAASAASEGAAKVAAEQSAGTGVPNPEATAGSGGSAGEPGQGETQDGAGGKTDTPGKQDVAAPAEADKTVVNYKMETATVVAADRARGLWGILESRLPADLPETERNRMVRSMENLIRTKFAGLTETQILEQYGFTSRDINLIHTGENLRLDLLISEQELKEIADGKNWTFDPSTEVPADADGTAAAPDTVGATETNEAEAATDTATDTADAPKGADASDAGTVAAAAAGNADAAASVGAKAASAATNVATPSGGALADAGSGRNIKLPPIDRQQGNYTPAMETNPRPFGNPQPRIFNADYTEAPNTNVTPEYSFESSNRDALFAEYADSNVNIRSLYEQNMMGIGRELFDIDTTEFGPNFVANDTTRTLLNREFGGRPMNGIVDQQGTQFESVYDNASRSGYRQPTYLQPRLDGGQDVAARNFENDVIHGYTGRIADMANAARAEFGLSGQPRPSERLASYLSRLGTLVTRERLRNPSFNFDF